MIGMGRLWSWFGLDRAAFLVLPRVLMHEMSDEWQGKMADLLNEYQETFPNQPDVETHVTILTRGGKRASGLSWLLNYRHPDQEQIDKFRQQPQH